MSNNKQREAFVLEGVEIAPGARATVDLQVAQLYTHTPLHIPVQVVHGRRPGPCLLVCAAIHGDEINGVEIIRRLLKLPQLQYLKGTLIAVPIVNVFGFIQQSRYLPDRRDLNRCFPGSERGSLGSRAAYLFRTRVLERCSHIIDLHTGAIHRTNLPQIRACLDNAESDRMARAFGVPVILNASLRDGSLRAEAETREIPVITYEAGEALRFDEVPISAGVKGVINVMRSLGMLRHSKKKVKEPDVVRNSSWVRAGQDGILRPMVALGARVKKGATLGMISSPLGEGEETVHATASGIVIGRTNLPLVYEGEALFHIATFETVAETAKKLEAFHEQLLQKDQWSSGELPLA